jgi:sulfatase modifying factor 1
VTRARGGVTRAKCERAPAPSVTTLKAVSLWGMSRSVRGAFGVAVGAAALVAVGCGGRTSGTNLSAASGTNTVGDRGAAAAGSTSGGTGVASGATTAEPAEASVDSSDDAGDAQVATQCPPIVPTLGGACAGNLKCSYDWDGGLTNGPYCSIGECYNGRWYGLSQCLFEASAPYASTDGMAGADASDDATSAPETGDNAGAPPSCAPGGPGMTNCGPDVGDPRHRRGGTESCCTSLEVAGGTFYRTYDGVGIDGYPANLSADGGPTGEADPATVSSFRLDKYLVTVGRFRQFVNVAVPPDGGPGWTPAAGSGKHTHLNGGNGLAATGGGYEPGWATNDSNIAPTNANLACGGPDDMSETWTNAAGSQENLPINCVNWWESYAFCIWDGGFLPSEAEWEYAAAGGSQQREYPWGSAAPETANQYAIYNFDYPSGSGTFTGVANIAPVGTATLGAGLWGQLDLAGEVWEWNLDGYANYTACTDCANFAVTGNSTGVIRGGYFGSTASCLLPPCRDFGPPSGRGYGVGFRCARTP